MVSAFLTKWLGLNWRTNLASFFAFLATVPSIGTAFYNWAHHMPVDWRGTVFGLAVSAGLALSKDARNRSTLDQVTAAQATVDANTPHEKRDALAMVKEADKDAAQQ